MGNAVCLVILTCALSLKWHRETVMKVGETEGKAGCEPWL